jgi:hypothetical protein
MPFGHTVCADRLFLRNTPVGLRYRTRYAQAIANE